MIFSFIITDLSGGGAEKAIVNLSQNLAARSHHVRLILLGDKVSYDLPADVSVIKLSSSSGPIGRGWLAKRRLAARLKRFSLSHDLGLTVSTLPFADEVVHLAKLPNHYCRIANTLSVEIQKLKEKSQFKARRRYSRYQKIYGAHPLIAVSDGVCEDLKTYFQLRTGIFSIPNGYDFEKIKALANEPLHVEFSSPYVLHVGRFSQQKRHDLLLDAWAKLQTDKKLVLLVPPDPQLVEMVSTRQLQDRVIIAGFQKNPYQWMKNACVLVLCSDHEGLPNVLLETLICGTPVVSTDCPSGPRQILRDAPECLVPMGDSMALAKVISEQLEKPADPSLIDLSSYSIDRVCEAYEKLAEKVK